MNIEYISACKLVNCLSVLLLCFCSHPLFFYGQSYNQYIVILGIAAYGLSLRWTGTNMDHLVRVK